MRSWCKHRTALLDGDVSNLLSDNVSDVKKLGDWADGMEVERRDEPRRVWRGRSQSDVNDGSSVFGVAKN